MQQQQMLIPLQIQRFWTEYKPDATDPAKLNPVDMVAYGPLGRIDNSLVVEKVSRLLKLHPFVPDNPASIMAHIRKDVIEKAYDAWRTGQELPLNGTPLAAWNGLTPEQAEIFKARSIRTVEEISLLNDATRAGIPLPNLHEIIAAAKRFVDSADQTRFAAAIAEKEKQLEAHKAILDEQKEINNDQRGLIADLIKKVEYLSQRAATEDAKDDDHPDLVVKRGPGRPPKVQTEA